jgi:hypothetical protein
MGLPELRALGIRLGDLREFVRTGVVAMAGPLPPPPRPRKHEKAEHVRTGRRGNLPPLTRPPTTPRTCMTCGETFQSEGAHNRMCEPCRRMSREISPYDPGHGSLDG